MNIPPIIIIIFVGGWIIALPLLIIAGMKNRKRSKTEMEARQYSGDKSLVAQVYNYIEIDSINGMPMEAYPIELAKRKKGRLAGPVEIIYLNPGLYHVTAHGVTYQTSPVTVSVELEAGKYYCLGANQAEVYLDERSYEWTLS